LRVVALDGSAPRVLLPHGAATWAEALDWSPDGKFILAGIVDRQEQTGLGLVSVADGSVRNLRTSLRYDPQDGRFSPDGLYVAYSRKTGTEGNSVRTRDVFLLAVDGSREIPVVQHPADDAFVDWLPDGRGILFGSDRDGTQDLWALAVEKGQAQGMPILVRRRVGPFTPLGLTRDGALYYRTPAPFMDVYTTSLDPKTGNVSGPPKKEPLSWEGSNRWPVWSPDGKRLAYVSARPTVVGPFQPGRAREFIVCVYSADTNLVREYRHEKVFTTPRWSPDRRHLYVAASNVDRRGIYSLDLDRGEYLPYVGAGENEPMRYFQFSGDGTWMVWVASRENVSIVVRRDTRTGEEKELDRVSGLSINGMALSRDGGHLAWVLMADKTTKILKVMELPDGTPKEIQRLTETGGGRTELAFSPDGQFIYYSDLPAAGGRDWHLWRIPSAGGTPQDVGLGVGSFEQLGVHPDGSRITFAAPTINPERSQVWVLENFLPATKR
jgi:Tol biopolymer transport system component